MILVDFASFVAKGNCVYIQIQVLAKMVFVGGVQLENATRNFR